MPVASVPIRFPTTTLPAAPKSSWMPVNPLPEITLPAPAAVPPMVLFWDARELKFAMSTPSALLGMAAVPAAFVPM